MPSVITAPNQTYLQYIFHYFKVLNLCANKKYKLFKNFFDILTVRKLDMLWISYCNLLLFLLTWNLKKDFIKSLNKAQKCQGNTKQHPSLQNESL
jgi:hypothetical protein